ncbi:MAG: helix-hairpin-helix domain-containing protein [Lachnospiraceae bacterium]|nr:helix-hairpin-helix domain-containing protein [Lachnospiraceae bacterium]
MQNIKIGLVTALLCFTLLTLSGCSSSAPIYTAGLTEETAADMDDSGRESDEDGTGTVPGAADSGKESDADGAGTASGADDTGTVSGAESAGTKSADAEESADSSDAQSGNVKTEGSTANNAQAEVSSNQTGVPDTLAGLSTSVSEASETEAIVGYVYVCGAVNDPGVYPIREDMRVCDAVELAGGFSAEADEEWLNQAATLSDGQKLYIYTVEETDLMRESGMVPEGMSGSASGTGISGTSDGTGGTDASSAGAAADGSGETSSSAAEATDSGTASDGRININTATREELMTLPGIGESKADAIVAYRDTHGAFASIEEIQNISGIKSGVFSQIKDLITV